MCLCAQRGRSAGVVKVVVEGGGSARRGGRIRLPSLLSLPAGDNGALAAGVDGDTGPPLRAGALLLPVGWLCASPNHMTCNTPTPPTGSLCVRVCICDVCSVEFGSHSEQCTHSFAFSAQLCHLVVEKTNISVSSFCEYPPGSKTEWLHSLELGSFTLLSLLMCHSRYCLSTTNNFAAK